MASQRPGSVAEQLYHVELAASFLERLASIEDLLEKADAAFAYNDLLAGLRGTMIPNLARFPLIGKRYLEQPPKSVEALAQLAQLPGKAIETLRVYLLRGYLIIYAVNEPKSTAYLLSICHQRHRSVSLSSCSSLRANRKKQE